MGRERVSRVLALSLGGAFIGLTLALDVGGNGLNTLGIVLSVTSAVTFTKKLGGSLGQTNSSSTQASLTAFGYSLYPSTLAIFIVVHSRLNGTHSGARLAYSMAFIVQSEAPRSPRIHAGQRFFQPLYARAQGFNFNEADAREETLRGV